MDEIARQSCKNDPKSRFSIVCGVDIVEIESIGQSIKVGGIASFSKFIHPQNLRFVETDYLNWQRV